MLFWTRIDFHCMDNSGYILQNVQVWNDVGDLKKKLFFFNSQLKNFQNLN